MAHNIHYNQKTDKHSFFSTKEKAWHGLGQLVQDFPTSAEALQFAGLNYQVEKRSLFTVDGSYLNEYNEVEYSKLESPKLLCHNPQRYKRSFGGSW